MKKKIAFILLFLAVTFTPFLGVSALETHAADTCTVSFWLDSETQYGESQVVEVGGYVDIPVTPEPITSGSYFLYWENGGEKFSFATQIHEDTNLYAKWESAATFYTVTFMVEGAPVSTQVVEKGDAAIAPATVICPEGKEFDRWDSSFDSVSRDMTVTAILKDCEYVVEFIGFHGEVVSSDTVVHGGTATAPTVLPDVANYDFDGYDRELTNITQNTTIQLLYAPKEFNVSYLLENGDEFIPAKTVAYGESTPFPVTAPQKENHVFLGWYVGDVAYDFNAPVQGDVVLRAKFLAVRHQVRFYTHDNVQYGATQWVENGESAIAPAPPVREGYQFVRWTEEFSAVTHDLEIHPEYSINVYDVIVVNAEGEEIWRQSVTHGGSLAEPSYEIAPIIEGQEFVGFEGSFRNVKEDRVITLKYRVQTFTVTFYHGTQKLGVTQYVEYGKSATPPAMAELEGYDFKGWTDGTDTSEEPYLCIQSDKVFFAKYQQRSYIVEFYEGDALVHHQSVLHGNCVDLYTYEKTDKIFMGWFRNEILSISYSFSEEVTAGFKLYAKWEDKPKVTYQVSFMVDGSPYSTQYVIENGSAVLPANPRREGYTFTGWTGSYENVTQDVTLTANFTINSYTITFLYGDGLSYQDTVTYLGSVTIPSLDTSKEGYSFIRWDSDDYLNVKKDATITAEYKKNLYYVTFYVGGSQLPIQYAYHGETVLPPATPSRLGYTFVGWVMEDKETPFDFTAPITKETNVYADFSINQYEVYYYVDGELWRTDLVEYGSVIEKPTPTFENPNTEFLGWTGLPGGGMPNYPLTAIAKTYTKQYYDLVYYVEGEEYQRISVLEDTAITPLANPTDLPENIKFLSWGNIPSYMPKHEVVVNAHVQLLHYYTYSFYVQGKQYAVVTALEGTRVSAPEVPEDYSDKFVVIGWDATVPPLMPAKNMTFNAQLRFYQTAYFYVDGALYDTVTVLQGQPITPPTVPSDYSDDFIVEGWRSCPSVMPYMNVNVNAIIHRYYKLTYTVDGVEYYSEKLLSGAEINLIQIPTENYSDEFVVSGWADRVPTHMPEYDYTVEAKLLRYYTLTYLLNDEVYYSEVVLEGNQATMLGAPEDLPEYIVFHAWNMTIGTMPSYDVTITAMITVLKYYNLSFYIDGVLYDTFTVLEGRAIELIQIPEDYSDDFVIDGWYCEYETMPQFDVNIHATLLRYYNITYLVNGSEYFTDRLLEGTALEMLGAPENLPENIVFHGWNASYEVMPDYDVIITAEITVLQYNEVIFYVNGVEVNRALVLEGKQIPLYEVPEDYSQDFVVGEWRDVPDVMPAHTLELHANIYFYYTVTYLLNGEFYQSQRYFEGQPVSPLAPPSLLDGESFIGWEGMPDTMPSYDVIVYGTVLSNTPNNLYAATTEQDDGSVQITLSVTGNVNFAGIVGSLNFQGEVEIAQSDFDESKCYVYANGNTVNFVWSQGENVTSETTLFSVTVRSTTGQTLSGANLNVSEMKAFTQNGVIVDVQFTNNL